jgi:hypothetical protein
MTLKCSWLWNGTAKAGNLSFGFSESWYTNDAPAVLLPKMEQSARFRVPMLARGTILYGYRIADTAPGSRAYTVFPSGGIGAQRGAGTPNVPQDAALCQCYGTVPGTVKRFWIHCLPDDFVKDGDFDPGSGVPGDARAYINNLATAGFLFRYTLPTSPIAKIQSIDNTGVVVLQAPLVGAALNSIVQLYHVRGVDGRGKRGKFTISAFVDNQHFTLGHWPGDVVGASGSLRLTTYGFTSIQQVPPLGLQSDPTIKPGTRKCGRPFGQLRGRAVARR